MPRPLVPGDGEHVRVPLLLNRLGKHGCMVSSPEAVPLVLPGLESLSSEDLLGGSSWDGSVKGPHRRCLNETAQFARDLNQLQSDASIAPRELAALLGRTEVLIYKYLQGVHLSRLGDLPEIAVALNLKSCRDLIPQEWRNPER